MLILIYTDMLSRDLYKTRIYRYILQIICTPSRAHKNRNYLSILFTNSQSVTIRVEFLCPHEMQLSPEGLDSGRSAQWLVDWRGLPQVHCLPGWWHILPVGTLWINAGVLQQGCITAGRHSGWVCTRVLSKINYDKPKKFRIWAECRFRSEITSRLFIGGHRPEWGELWSGDWQVDRRERVYWEGSTEVGEAHFVWGISQAKTWGLSERFSQRRQDSSEVWVSAALGVPNCS